MGLLPVCAVPPADDACTPFLAPAAGASAEAEMADDPEHEELKERYDSQHLFQPDTLPPHSGDVARNPGSL